MIVYLGYSICLLVLGLYFFFVFAKWGEIKALSIQDKSSAISNGTQVIFLCLGSMVGLYSLDVALFSSQREQDIKTSELFDLYQIESLSDQMQQYRTFIVLALSERPWSGFEEDKRIQELTQIWNAGVSNEYESFKQVITDLSNCASTSECDSDRVHSAICRETGWLLKFIALEPFSDLPGDMLDFVYSSRDFFAEQLWEACRPGEYFSGYFDGWLARPHGP